MKGLVMKRLLDNFSINNHEEKQQKIRLKVYCDIINLNS